MTKRYEFIIKNPMLISYTEKKEHMDGPRIYDVFFENLDILPVDISEDKEVKELKTLIRTCMRDAIDPMTLPSALPEKWVKTSQHVLKMSIPDHIVRSYQDYEHPIFKCRVYTSYGSNPYHTVIRFTVCDLYEGGDMKINFFKHADTNTNKEENNMSNNFNKPEVKKVIYNDPATIIFWSDGTKTIVKCTDDEPYDPEKGFMAAVTKKYFDEKYGWNIRKHVKPEIEARNC